jgi:hypothetical protein
VARLQAVVNHFGRIVKYTGARAKIRLIVEPAILWWPLRLGPGQQVAMLGLGALRVIQCSHLLIGGRLGLDQALQQIGDSFALIHK